MFLCEHWLTVHELTVFNNNFKSKNNWGELKVQYGFRNCLVDRPYGGIGFVARIIADIVHKPINVDSDRIGGIQIISNEQILMTLLGVYLPYYKSSIDQIELYCETLDILQSTIDNLEPSPVMIVGDMNTTLPMNQEFPRSWHRRYPFNVYSNMLHDCICNNDLVVANFAFEQPSKYTYFSSNNSSYIDHVFLSRFAECMHYYV